MVYNTDWFAALILFFEGLGSAKEVKLWVYSKEVTLLNNFHFHHEKF